VRPLDLVGSDVDRGRDYAGEDEQPCQPDHRQVGALGEQRKRHHGIEQHRQLELVAEVGGALGGVVGPLGPAHGEVGVAALAVYGADGARSSYRQRRQNAQREEHLHEYGIEDCDLGHDGARPGSPGPFFLCED